jgi:hypothetical protein
VRQGESWRLKSDYCTHTANTSSGRANAAPASVGATQAADAEGKSIHFLIRSILMKMKRVVTTVTATLLSFVAASAAWAGTGNGSGYVILQDGSCTLGNAGDICDLSFVLPAQARVADSSILSYVETCTDLGSGIDFDVDIRVNGTSVKTYSFGSGTQRGLWEDIGANIFVLGSNNLLEFVASGADVGQCSFQDINLQYRLTTVP